AVARPGGRLAGRGPRGGAGRGAYGAENDPDRGADRRADRGAARGAVAARPERAGDEVRDVGEHGEHAEHGQRLDADVAEVLRPRADEESGEKQRRRSEELRVKERRAERRS